MEINEFKVISDCRKSIKTRHVEDCMEDIIAAQELDLKPQWNCVLKECLSSASAFSDNAQLKLLVISYVLGCAMMTCIIK